MAGISYDCNQVVLRWGKFNSNAPEKIIIAAASSSSLIYATGVNVMASIPCTIKNISLIITPAVNIFIALAETGLSNMFFSATIKPIMNKVITPSSIKCR